MSTTDDASKRPAFQFYANDWLTDDRLRECSAGARGLWIDLMAIAHGCRPYGHLAVEGRPMGERTMAARCGLLPQEFRKLLGELEANGVLRRTDDGTIYSKRMVLDERARAARAEGGKLGAEHGAKGGSHGIKGGRPPNDPTKGRGVSKPPSHPPSEPPPSSSSSFDTPLPPAGDGLSADADRCGREGEVDEGGRPILRLVGAPERLEPLEPVKWRKGEPVPAEEIVAAYHRRLPMLARVAAVNDKRQRAMAKLWQFVRTTADPEGNPRGATPAEAMQWIDDYFATVALDDFITGRIKPGPGHEGWHALFDYVVRDSVVIRVIEKPEAA